MAGTRFCLAFVLFLALAVVPAHGAATAVQTTANPIRRVVTMLQMMQKKVEAEGKKAEELFDKFMCYCKTGEETLAKSIADAETKIPQIQSDLKESIEHHAQLGEDLKQHKADREDAKAAIAKATSMREKESAAFEKENGESIANLDALSKAIPAIEKGMAGFLQTGTASVLRRLSLTQQMTSVDRDMLSAFLAVKTEGGAQYAPASGEILGILKQMKDTMEKDLAELQAEEDAKKSDFEGLVAAKQKEIESATAAIETKMQREGELAVAIVELKNDLEDTQETLAEDKKFLSELGETCKLKEKEWAAYEKEMQNEVLAIAETIKILNDDDALELFKKTLPSSAAFLQVETSAADVRKQALGLIRDARAKSGDAHSTNIDIVMLALQSKTAGFEKVIKMIDDMVVLLGKEQAEDDAKKEYCLAEFDKAEDKQKGLELDIGDLDKVIAEEKDLLGTLAEEIKALNQGIHDLDKSVAEATEQRKEEHAEFTQTRAANGAAKELILFAKNRMQKFYNPKLYKPPPKRELTEEERITLNMGGTLAPTNPPGGIAGTGVSFEQGQAAPPPPPAADLSYKKKGEESGGVLAMMDSLVADIDKETQTLEFDEKDAQEDYEKMMMDAAAKRKADSQSITEKEAATAATEEELQANTDAQAALKTELMETKEYLATLHGDCDWLLDKYDLRKEARDNEIDAIKKAKAVLSGANYDALLQVHSGRKHLRRVQRVL